MIIDPNNNPNKRNEPSNTDALPDEGTEFVEDAITLEEAEEAQADDE